MSFHSVAHPASRFCFNYPVREESSASSQDCLKRTILSSLNTALTRTDTCKHEKTRDCLKVWLFEYIYNEWVSHHLDYPQRVPLAPETNYLQK